MLLSRGSASSSSTLAAPPRLSSTASETATVAGAAAWLAGQDAIDPRRFLPRGGGPLVDQSFQDPDDLLRGGLGQEFACAAAQAPQNQIRIVPRVERDHRHLRRSLGDQQKRLFLVGRHVHKTDVASRLAQPFVQAARLRVLLQIPDLQLHAAQSGADLASHLVVGTDHQRLPLVACSGFG